MDLGWQKPKPHPFNLKDFPEGAVHTQDNKVLYFASVRPAGFGEGDIYIFENNQVQNLEGPINTKYMEAEPYISPDGATPYFASNRPGGKGKTDIWLSRKIAVISLILTGAGPWSLDSKLKMKNKKLRLKQNNYKQ